ncbi:hypothetical protein LSAT2_025084 [Lamellibrachia satsuma]|nr:hypothetical protein LSAT2_025084 [Lamellibrachia satsuma]
MVRLDVVLSILLSVSGVCFGATCDVPEGHTDPEIIGSRKHEPSGGPGEVDGHSTPDSPGEVDGHSTPDIPSEVDGHSTPDSPGEVDGHSTPDSPGEVDGHSTPDSPGEVDGHSTPDSPGEVDGHSTPDSLSSTVRDKNKIDQISPLIKKTRLNIEVTQDYRSVSNVASLSKVIERIVIRQLNVRMQENNVGNLFQSTYRRHHSAEIALLKADGAVLQVIDVSGVAVRTTYTNRAAVALESSPNCRAMLNTKTRTGQRKECCEGYEENANSICVESGADVDECQTTTHGCSQTCVNTVGSYRCECEPGYQLHTDGRTCNGPARPASFRPRPGPYPRAKDG